MPAFVCQNQVSNSYDNARIREIVWLESQHLTNEYAVSIVDSRVEDIWMLSIQSPYGEGVSRSLHRNLGELVPAVFRIRFRELLRTL